MSEPEIIDGEVVDQDQPAPDAPPVEPTGVALAPRQRRSEVIRPLDAGQLIESFHAYQELLPQLLTDSDYQAAEAGKRFVKKSGWRKIATAFDLDVVIVAEEVERDTDGRILRAKTTARATAPSGRVMDGDGYCTVNEFTGRRAQNPKLENDLRGTAATRAKNRAISDLVGMGEVSAEEVDGGSGSHTPAAPQIIARGDATNELVAAIKELTGAGPDDSQAIRNLWEYICGDLERPSVTVAKIVHAIHAQQATFAARTTDPEPAPADEGAEQGRLA